MFGIIFLVIGIILWVRNGLTTWAIICLVAGVLLAIMGFIRRSRRQEWRARRRAMRQGQGQGSQNQGQDQKPPEA